MDKLTAIKIKYDDGTYSDEIPVSVLSENVGWNSTLSLVDILGQVDTSESIQDQINNLKNTRATNNAISSEAATRASADSNLQSQINQIIAPSGEAPSAAEVQNARIGVNGVTYDTLGDAIRGQVNDLKINKINVRDYGAVGDGVTNDQGAIIKALAAASDKSIVYFPSGTYLVSGYIVIDRSISIIGDGGCDKYYTDGNTTILLSPKGNSILNVTADHVYIHGITFNGNSCTVGGSGIKKSSTVSGNGRKFTNSKDDVVGIIMNRTTSCVIDECRFLKFSNYAINCGTFSTIKDCVFNTCSNMAIYVTHPDVTIDGCEIILCNRGIYVNNGDACRIINNRIEQMTEFGIAITSEGAFIVGTWIDSCDSAGILILGDNNTVKATTINRCGRFYAMFNISDIPTDQYNKACNIVSSGNYNNIDITSAKGSYDDSVNNINTPALSMVVKGGNYCMIKELLYGFGNSSDVVNVSSSINTIRYIDNYRDINKGIN